MSKTKIFLKKTAVAIIGIPILIFGVILIPLPGPGILISVLGLYILSFAFGSVDARLKKFKNRIRDIYINAKARHDNFIDKYDNKKK